jgi:hypothetical protein
MPWTAIPAPGGSGAPARPVLSTCPEEGFDLGPKHFTLVPGYGLGDRENSSQTIRSDRAGSLNGHLVQLPPGRHSASTSTSRFRFLSPPT